MSRSAEAPALRPRRRVFAGPQQFQDGEVFLSPAEAHHLRRVLRLGAGDRVEVVDGQGRIFAAEICRLSAHDGQLRLCGEIAAAVESPLQLTLGQALVRAEAFDLIVRQVTEMGVCQLIPFYAERSLVRADAWQPGKLTRWQRLAQEAVKTSERARLPLIAPPVTFHEVLTGSEEVKLICWEDLRHQERRQPWTAASRPRQVRLLIGPEGGFTAQEVAAAQAAGFQLLGLGPRRLRVETAAVAAVSLLQYLWGDLCP